VEIEKAIIRFCAGKNISVTKERVQMQADYLRGTEYSDDKIIDAIESLFGETSFFPDASLILKKLKPDSNEIQIEAQGIADKILDANGRFSSFDQKAARNFIGEAGWFVVERFGGWDSVTNLTYSELNTARAQLRKIAEGAVYAKTSNPKLDYTKQAKVQLEQNIEQGLRSLDFSEFTK